MRSLVHILSPFALLILNAGCASSRDQCQAVHGLPNLQWATVGAKLPSPGPTRAVTIGDDIFVLNEQTLEWYRFDALRRRFSVMAQPATPRAFIAPAADGEKLYIAGGIAGPVGPPDGSESLLDSIEVYDPHTDQWSPWSQGLPEPRAGGALAWFGDELLYQGGVTEPRGEASANGYITQGDGAPWELLSATEASANGTITSGTLGPSTGEDMVLVATRHDLQYPDTNDHSVDWIVQRFVRDTDIYDIHNWLGMGLTNAMLYQQRVDMSVTCLCGSVVLLGGWEDNTNTALAGQSSRDSDAVFVGGLRADPMPYGVSRAGAAVHDGKVYIFGGQTTGDFFADAQPFRDVVLIGWPYNTLDTSGSGD